MENKVSKKAVSIVSKLLALVALAFVSTASVFWLHRPETPKELLSKK